MNDGTICHGCGKRHWRPDGGLCTQCRLDAADAELVAHGPDKHVYTDCRLCYPTWAEFSSTHTVVRVRGVVKIQWDNVVRAYEGD